eukprot:CAMPEP_0119381320 /NCGR_PEP_ID=MMETSP1334-20130426/63093_1 /TAXON_ID=127549 /ORGANISM="Calcidiscus leptoporus, Strain RCC1130" /LENGTH=39 /DNA_ID= /DNA_START= /DNA_END= /DNA_ORIENTATION=
MSVAMSAAAKGLVAQPPPEGQSELARLTQQHHARELYAL